MWRMKVTPAALSMFSGLLLGATQNCANGAPPSAALAWPHTFATRTEALTLLNSLNADLLSHDSATATLEHWCDARRLATPPHIVAEKDLGALKPPTPEQRRLLRVAPADRVSYRHVRLRCGSLVLSEADNWYVPGRLTPEMNRLLETTDQPFGRVIQSLHFQRQTISSRLLWQPLAAGQSVPARVLRHRALLTLPDGTPLSEVEETYTDNVLAIPTPSPAGAAAESSVRRERSRRRQ